jgi:hypothetical protein
VADSGEQYILRMMVDVQNEQALRDLNKLYGQVGQGLVTTNRQMGQSSRTSKQFGYALQSAGYQASDFFVQVQGGVSVTRALSQQLPQLLAGFGSFGGPVMIGAVAVLSTMTALLPTIAKLLGETEDEMRSVTDVAADFTKALDNATGNVVRDTLDRYDTAIREATDATRLFLQVQREYADQDFAAATARSARELTTMATDLSAPGLTGDRVTGGRIEAIAPRFQSTPRDQQIADNIQAANDQIVESYKALVDQLNSGQLSLENFVATVLTLREAGLVGGQGIRELVDAAGELLRLRPETLDEHLEGLRQLTGSMQVQAGNADFALDYEQYLPSDSEMQTLDEFVDGINELTGALNGALTPVQAGVNWEDYLPGEELTEKQRKLREELVKQAEAYQFQQLPAAERYRQELERLEDTIQTLGLSTETASALTDQLSDRYKVQAEAVRDVSMQMSTAQEFTMNAFESFDRNFQSFVDGIARGTTELEDLFKRMAASIIADLMRIYLTQALTGLFLGGGTRGTTAGIPTTLDPSAYMAKGGAFQNGVQAFATGGIVSSPTMFPMARGMGLMGEAGAEAIMPLSRMPDGKLGVESSAANVVINNYAGAEVSATQTDVGLIVDIVRATVANDVEQGGNRISNAYANAFGVQRAGI